MEKKESCSSSSLPAPVSVMLGATVTATTTTLTTVVMATVLTSRAGGTSNGRERENGYYFIIRQSLAYTVQ